MKDTSTPVSGDRDVIPARRLLRTREAASYLAVSPRTLWTLLNTSQIPSIRFGAGTRPSIRVDVRDLDAWIAGHKGGRR